MAWKNTNELLDKLQAASNALEKGEMPVDAAHADARILGTAVKAWNIRLEHAKMTRRLKEGSNELPDVNIT